MKRKYGVGSDEGAKLGMKLSHAQKKRKVKKLNPRRRERMLVPASLVHLLLEAVRLQV